MYINSSVFQLYNFDFDIETEITFVHSLSLSLRFSPHRCQSTRSSTESLSDSANCVVPVTRSLAFNHPNRRPLIIRGAIKEANVGSTGIPVRSRGFPPRGNTPGRRFLYFRRIYLFFFYIHTKKGSRRWIEAFHTRFPDSTRLIQMCAGD